ncbi:MAG: dienelactone hydrolase family protein [Gammaproteobacteria bacterium]
MTRKKASDYDQRVLDLFDHYVHGRISRREFLDRAAACSLGGLTAAAILESLVPDFAAGQRIAEDDQRLEVAYDEYSSPKGSGTMRGYLARSAERADKLDGIVVIHENRGLNPHIEDIARRLALEGYLAFAPDALTPLGGYPGDESTARTMFRDLDRAKTVEDFIAAVGYIEAHADCTGNVGCVGFCFGGSVANILAVRVPTLKVAVAFYGGPPNPEDVPKIEAAVQLHYAGNDERINARWPAYEEALKAAGTVYEGYMYPGTNHGFNNDTTPRFDEAAADLAWGRTLVFFEEHLS